MWECPITTYMSEIINQQTVERENAITLKVSETIGVDVNREELIKALKYDRHQYEKGYADAKAEFAPKWTRVEDELPEESNYCLCCDKDGYMTIGYVSKYSKKWCFDDEEVDMDVVAWTPLPEPYKAESEAAE